MTRRVLPLLGSTLALILLASAGHGAKPKKQEVEGTIALPAPAPIPGDEVCNSGLQRRLRLFSQGSFPNGLVGYDFDVDPGTTGGKFVLEVTAGQDVDLDISFYQGMGSTSDPAGAPANQSFEERAVGGEEGVVPPGYDKVIVCMYQGSNATFTYTAVGAKKKKR